MADAASGHNTDCWSIEDMRESAAPERWAHWAVAMGLLQIIAAIRLRREIDGEWLLILGGLASIVFGVLLMAQPAAGALVLLWLIAAYAIVFGVIMVIVAFRARSFARRLAQL